MLCIIVRGDPRLLGGGGGGGASLLNLEQSTNRNWDVTFQEISVLGLSGLGASTPLLISYNFSLLLGINYG